MDSNHHYRLVEKTLAWIAENQSEQPSLAEIASAVDTSPYHLQRVFQDWAGVTPKQFLKSLTRTAALERLEAGDSVLDAALSSGLSGPGRLHDLMVSTEALTPGEIRRGGAGVELEFGFGPSPFGEALIAWGPMGISFLGFCSEVGRDRSLADLRARLSNATFHQSDAAASRQLRHVFEGAGSGPLRVWLRGSPFQLKVWEALLAIPEGDFASYAGVARRADAPRAFQAVGNAVGANPVAWIIPCHRVIRRVGELGEYHWGQTVKRAMAGFEAAAVSRDPAPAG